MNKPIQPKPVLSTDDTDLRRCQTCRGLNLCKSVSSVDKKVFFSLRILRLFAAFAFCCLGCASAYSAPAADFEKILGNMGNIGFDGLPRLSFEMVDPPDAGELASLGFGFRLTHQTVLRHGRTAGSRWNLSGLQTCAYSDTQGDIVWLTTSGQTVRFRKSERGYASGNNNATVTVSPDGNLIEITTQASVKWRYRDGFLESITSGRGSYAVTTDRETILSISKKILNREIVLLKCSHSKQGFLNELEFAGGKKYRLQWSANHDLLAIDGPEGRRFDFEYANSLLTCWTQANGPRNELKWRHLDYIRETAFQIPPVLLREDASYSYEYKLDKFGRVEFVIIHDKSGALVSETKMGTTGVEQTAPNGKLKHKFKKTPCHARPVFFCAHTTVAPSPVWQ